MRFSLVAVLLLTASVPGAEPTYWQDVRPVLRKHCTVCHSIRNLKEAEISGGLALDSYEAVVKNVKKPLVQAGKSGSSLLLQVLVAADSEKRMPLGVKPLPEETIALLRRWVDAGVPEGQRADADSPVVVGAPSRVRKKLDVVLPTTATPPAGALGPGVPAPLQLVLPAGPLAPMTALAFSPDGKRLAAGAYGQVTIWDTATGQAAKVLTNVLGVVSDVRFSPDGQLLAIAGGQPSAKGDLRLVETASWKPRGALAGHDDVVASVAFSPDGKRLASASFDKTVRLWDVASRKLERVLTGHSDFVHAVAFGPDGQWLASASKDRSVKVVESATGKSRFTFSGMEQDVLAVAVSRDGKFVVSSGFEPGLHWWNAQTGERVRVQGGHGVAVHELCFSTDGKLLASAGGDGTVRLWDGVSGALTKTLAVGPLVYAVALSSDGKLAAVGSFDGLTRVYDVASSRHLVTLVTLPGDGVGWLALTPQGHVSAGSRLPSVGRWRMGPQDVAGDAAWKWLQQPDAVARAFRGEVLPAPVFRK